MPSKRFLDRIDEARGDDMIEGLGGKRTRAADEWANPGLKQIRRLSDEELAEIIAREPSSYLGALAVSVQRGRESWRTPARPALIVSLLSLAVAVLALARTL